MCVYIYIYAIMKNNVPSRLSPPWLCGNSCTCVFLLWDLSTLCVVDHLWPLYIYICIYIYIYIYIYTYIVIYNELKILVLPIGFQFSNNYSWQWSPPTLLFRKVFDLLSYRKTTCIPITWSNSDLIILHQAYFIHFCYLTPWLIICTV